MKVSHGSKLDDSMQYFTFAGFGLPYMGVGRNMAFKKASGFSAVEKIKLADNMRLV